jgi:Uma2 family endonuclease
MAIILTMTRPVTDEELLELARLNPGYQFERDARGEIIVTPTSAESGWREVRLIRQLDRWAERDGRGLTFSPSTMFILPDGSRFMPDASWILRERYEQLTEAQRRGWCPLCPDAVFEIASPSNRAVELRAKLRAYLDNGARIGVLIDPENRTVAVYRPGQEPHVIADAKSVALDPALPGFSLELEPIFTV